MRISDVELVGEIIEDPPEMKLRTFLDSAELSLPYLVRVISVYVKSQTPKSVKPRIDWV